MPNPACTVDAILVDGEDRVLLIERKNPPHGWALPGGFVDPGERLDQAVLREVREETGLGVSGLFQFATYSDPSRDPRGHTVSTVYAGTPVGQPRADTDASEVAWLPLDALPPMAFDHRRILEDYLRFRRTGERPRLP